ncbi:MAG: hypothetical protein PXX83_08120 [Candidatus Nitrosotalea sp.]|nr:hypothetical protein [Candidatus Nitrosotalea sp.]
MEESIALPGMFSDSIDNSYLDELAKEHDIVDYLAGSRRHASKVD